jgi:uncharacterized protein (DUF849 family)
MDAQFPTWVADWAGNRRALLRGHGICTGLEDSAVLPHGRLAKDNAELVRAAVELMTLRNRPSVLDLTALASAEVRAAGLCRSG